MQSYITTMIRMMVYRISQVAKISDHLTTSTICFLKSWPLFVSKDWGTRLALAASPHMYFYKEVRMN